MGVLIDSPTLASGLARAFSDVLPGASYRPALSGDGALVWTETLPGSDVLRHDHEPAATPLTPTILSLLGTLPIKWLL